ncbi:hypothetical protein [Actinophytocola glycyrrhizae]|uniref:DUF4878 domain-containing protein n=1 Tax=Actinophytocola glycyrrhizae TaxID=2044873 RepID=A0ABV9SBH1_9PSEU
MTYPQQPYGGQDPYAGYGGYGAPPPPPPRKKNTAAIVAVVAAVVVVLAGLGITGFVAPGFFLSDDDTPTGGSPTTTQPTTSSAEPGTDGAEEVLSAVADGLDTQDKDALSDVACTDAASVVEEAIDDADNVTGAELVDTEEIADDEVMGTLEVSVDDRTGEFAVTVTEVDGEWCWQDIELVEGPETSEPTKPTTKPSGPGGGGGEPTAGGKPVPADALAAMQSFLDAVNAGDAAAAKGTLCGDAISTPADVDELVGYDPDLAIDPAMDGISSGDKSVQLYLHGTAKGQELEGYSTNLWVTSYDGPWCVHAFRAVVI